MTIINTKLKKEVYESKKARDLLDEEFIEFLPIKRNINEFFDVYNNKFYNIINPTHDFFIKQSLQYIVDYINPKKVIKQTLLDQKLNLQIEIDSIEQFHPIFSNETVLNNGGVNWYIIQSGRRRKIEGGKNSELLAKIRETLGKKLVTNKNWTIEVSSVTISSIPAGPPVKTIEDLLTPIYTINTGKALPPNIYIG